MDEFDVFLARAYGGSQRSSPSGQVLDSDVNGQENHHRLNLNPGPKSGRRHSSVGFHQRSENIYSQSNDVSSRSSQRKHDSTGNGIAPGARRKRSSTVLVAIEPPSPTDLLQNDSSFSSRRKKSMSAHDGMHDVIGSENEAAAVDDAKSCKQFNRSRTAPVKLRKTSTSPVGEKHARITSRQHDSPVMVTQDAYANSKASSKTGINDSIGTGPIARPDNLLLTGRRKDNDMPTVTIGGDVTPGMSRRRSATDTPEAQHLAVSSQPSAGTLRRNSCIGAVSYGRGLRPPSGSSTSVSPVNTPANNTGLLPTSARSGRRNSAITYLTESNSLLAAPGRCSPRVAGSPGGVLAGSERRSFSADGAIVNPSQLQALLELSARCQGGDLNDMSPEGGSTGVTSLQSLMEKHVCRVAVLGAHEVGKSTLTSQLLTSEYLANKENYQG